MSKRRWILWVLLISFVWLIVSRADDLESLFLTLSQGIWLWVLAAALIQACYYLAQAALYKAAFATVGISSRLFGLVPVVLGSLFVNVVAPAGGTAGMALFVDDAAQNNQSAAKAAAGTVLAIASMYLTLTLMLLSGLIYLSFNGSVSLIQFIAALLLTAITAAVVGLLFLGYRQPNLLRLVFHRLQQVANRLSDRIIKRPFLQSSWANQTSFEFTEAATAMRSRPYHLLLTVGLATVSHSINILTLYALFRAFRYDDVTGMGLMAGYAVGQLFVVVAPTPQGVGFVENIMPNVFISLGVPSAVATIAVLAYRGLTFWLPLLIGFFLLRRLKSLGAEERSLTEVWSVRIVALLTALMGVINAWTALLPDLDLQIPDIPGVPPELAGEIVDDLAKVIEYSPLEVQRGGQLTGAVSGLALILLATALWRRKRAAWIMTLIVLAFSVATHLWQGDWVVAGLGAALGLWLFSLRPHFHARSDRPSVRQAIQLFVAGCLFIFAYGVLGYYFLSALFDQPFALTAAVRQTLTLMTRFYDPGFINTGEAGRLMALAVFLLSGLLYVYVFVLLLRPVLVRHPMTPEQRRRAEEIVNQYGQSAQAVLALWRSHFFHFSNNNSLVAYDLNGRTAIALGDPVGPAEEAPEAIDSFRLHCQRNDWTPAFYQVRPQYLAHYEELGFSVVGIGQEGRIDLAELSLDDPQYQSFLEQVGRIRAAGYRVEIIHPALSDDLLDTLQIISDEWLTMVNIGRKRVWLGWFDREVVRRQQCAVVYAPDDAISAFATIIESPNSENMAIDLLQHRSQVAPGTIALLFHELISWAQSSGLRTLYCGTSPLDEGSQAGKNRLLNSLYQNMSRYTFRDSHEVERLISLDWSMRYLAIPGTASLPAVWGAVLSGEGDSLIRTALRQRFRPKNRSDGQTGDPR